MGPHHKCGLPHTYATSVSTGGDRWAGRGHPISALLVYRIFLKRYCAARIWHKQPKRHPVRDPPLILCGCTEGSLAVHYWAEELVAAGGRARVPPDATQRAIPRGRATPRRRHPYKGRVRRDSAHFRVWRRVGDALRHRIPLLLAVYLSSARGEWIEWSTCPRQIIFDSL